MTRRRTSPRKTLPSCRAPIDRLRSAKPIKGIAPLLIVLIVAAAVASGLGGYVIVSKQRGSSPLEPIAKIADKISPPSPDELQGMWKIEKVSGIDPSTGTQVVFDSSDVSSPFREIYFEFKGAELCAEGRLDPAGYPLPCAKYVPIIIEGSVISVRESASRITTLRWTIRSGKLELDIEQAGEKKIHWTLTRLQPGEVDPALTKLQGIWVPIEFLALDPKTGSFGPTAEGSKDRYLEIKAHTICDNGYLDAKGAPRPCDDYKQFSLLGSELIVSGSDAGLTIHWEFAGEVLKFTLKRPASSSQPASTFKIRLTRYPAR